MKDRIKQIRKESHHGKNQQEFADFLGVSLSNIASYESGRRTPSDAVISLMCEKCMVKENWLRYGTGQKNAPEEDIDIVSDIASKLYHLQEDDFRLQLIKNIATWDEEKTRFFKDLIEGILNKKEP